jgi:hypothetical protein
MRQNCGKIHMKTHSKLSQVFVFIQFWCLSSEKVSLFCAVPPLNSTKIEGETQAKLSFCRSNLLMVPESKLESLCSFGSVKDQGDSFLKLDTESAQFRGQFRVNFARVLSTLTSPIVLMRMKITRKCYCIPIWFPSKKMNITAFYSCPSRTHQISYLVYIHQNAHTQQKDNHVSVSQAPAQFDSIASGKSVQETSLTLMKHHILTECQWYFDVYAFRS